jgi:hypothetical protein
MPSTSVIEPNNIRQQSLFFTLLKITKNTMKPIDVPPFRVYHDITLTKER